MIKYKKVLLACSLIVCLFGFSSIPVSADTDGTELNVLEPSKLEIQLGLDWSGVQFQLKTDVGLYPEEITVGEDGVLRLEIGGSSTYILTCINYEVAAPNRDHTDSKPLSENSDEETMAPSGSDAEEESTSENVDEDIATVKESTGTVAGIPITHLLLFGGGLLLSVGTLITIHVISNRKRELYEYDDDEEDE